MVYFVDVACFNYREFDLAGDVVGAPMRGIYRPIFNSTNETCLRRVGHGGFQ